MRSADVQLCKGYGKISKIKDVVLLLVPKDMDDETRAAYAAIEKKNVASEIEVDNDYSPLIFNGDTEITDASLPDGKNAVIVNGNARIFRLSPGKTAKVTVNGNLLYDIRSKSQIQIIGVNGDIKAINLISWLSFHALQSSRRICFARTPKPSIRAASLS